MGCNNIITLCNISSNNHLFIDINNSGIESIHVEKDTIITNMNLDN